LLNNALVSARRSSSSNPQRFGNPFVPRPWSPVLPLWCSGHSGITSQWLERLPAPVPALLWCISAGVPANPIRRQTAQPRSATRERCFFSSLVMGAGSPPGANRTPLGRVAAPAAGVVRMSRPGHLRLDRFGGGGGSRTHDLRTMNPTSYHCSTPRQIVALPSAL
jgi:hypothetical protein